MSIITTVKDKILKNSILVRIFGLRQGFKDKSCPGQENRETRTRFHPFIVGRPLPPSDQALRFPQFRPFFHLPGSSNGSVASTLWYLQFQKMFLSQNHMMMVDMDRSYQHRGWALPFPVGNQPVLSPDNAWEREQCSNQETLFDLLFWVENKIKTCEPSLICNIHPEWTLTLSWYVLQANKSKQVLQANKWLPDYHR